MTLHFDGRVQRGDFTVTAQFDCAAGEILGILGPNGSGKSTLLDTVAGLHRLAAGSLRAGTAVWDDARAAVPVRTRGVGSMTARGDLFPHLSALDNVAFGLRARGASRAAARKTAADELGRVGIENLARRRPADLSSGQQQRVALARALALDPPVLLLDEPLAAIDAASRREMRALIAERLRGTTTATLLVTHDPLDALTLTDRLLFLDGGHVTQVGTPAEVVREPRSRFAAGVVGLNVWRGTLENDQYRNVVRLDSGARVVGTAGEDTGLTPLQKCFVAFSPAAVSLWLDTPSGSPRNTWTLVVRHVEHTGSSARVHLNGEVDLVADVTLESVAALRLAPGRDVVATVKATDIAIYR